MIGSPGNEVPSRPVPEAGEDEYCPKVDVETAGVHPVATQRNVEVVAHPTAQRDVPALPELGDGARDVGVVEVFRELKSHHPPQANGHVGVAREVEINLKSVGQCPQPGLVSGQGSGDLIKNKVGLFAQHVGNKHLFGEADDEAKQACQLLIHGIEGGTVGELARDFMEAHDRPGNHLRK